MRCIAAAALCLLGLGQAQAADSLDALRASLRGLPSSTPVTATVERFVSSQRKDRPLTEGRVVLDVNAGSSGLSIAYPPALLAQLEAERAELDPEKPRTALNVLLGFDIADIASLLNHAHALLRDLEGARLIAESNTDWQGQKAQLLELDLVVRTSKADSKWIKSQRRSMKLWVTPEGLPLASEDQQVVRVGFLFLNFDATNQNNSRYLRAGDRLVVAQTTNRFEGEGLGEEQRTRSETSVRVPGL